MTSTNPEPEKMPAVSRIAPELDVFRARGIARAVAAGKSPGSPEAAAYFLCDYYADAMGLTALASLELSWVRGRIVVSAKLLRALAKERGYRIVPVEQTAEQATAAVVEIATGEELGRRTFTVEDAANAGLLKDSKPDAAWSRWRARMLWARAAKFAIDDYAPEVSVGLLTAEEAAEIEGPRTGVPDSARPDEPEADEAPPPSSERDPAAAEPEAAEWEPIDAEAVAQAVEDVAADDELSRARARHFGFLGRLEDAGVTPPEGFSTWDAVSRAKFEERWPSLDSRAELSPDQWRELSGAVEEAGGSVPF